MAEYTREELIAICEASSVPQDKWRDRDSKSAQEQIGKCWSLLRAGCPFRVCMPSGRKGENCVTNDRTIWVEVTSEGFRFHDYGGDEDCDTFYLPTRKRLEDRAGSDWY